MDNKQCTWGLVNRDTGIPVNGICEPDERATWDAYWRLYVGSTPKRIAMQKNEFLSRSRQEVYAAPFLQVVEGSQNMWAHESQASGRIESVFYDSDYERVGYNLVRVVVIPVRGDK